jgi:hypothetical protein
MTEWWPEQGCMVNTSYFNFKSGLLGCDVDVDWFAVRVTPMHLGLEATGPLCTVLSFFC